MQVVENDPLLAPVAHRGDDGRYRNDAGGQPVGAEHGVHERALAAAEAADHDEVETVLGEAGEERAHLFPLGLLLAAHRGAAQELGQRRLDPVVLPQVHQKRPMPSPAKE